MPGFVTHTFHLLGTAFVGIMNWQVICVGVSSRIVASISVDPVCWSRTIDPDLKPVPLMVTGTVAPWTPRFGAIEVTVTGSYTVTVNPSGRVALWP